MAPLDTQNCLLHRRCVMNKKAANLKVEVLEETLKAMVRIHQALRLSDADSCAQ